MHVLLVGNGDAYCLESSYHRAFTDLGMVVSRFDVNAHLKPFIPFGQVGNLFHTFIPIDTWQRKMNRELALQIHQLKPALVLIFGNAPVLFSTLAFAKSVTECKFVLVWPDPLTNLQPHLQQAANLYDGVATYCNASVSIFEQLGFKNVYWIPLAADPHLHQQLTPATTFLYDLTFIGAFRPERGEVLARIAAEFPSLKLAIWGTDWRRNAHKVLVSAIHHQALRGPAYADLLNRCRINLNVIDYTCYPAANMRFFEIPIAQGLQLVNPCPEMQSVYRSNEHILYYSSENELFTQIEFALTRPADVIQLRQAGYALTLANHTYHHRALQLQTLFVS